MAMEKLPEELLMEILSRLTDSFKGVDEQDVEIYDLSTDSWREVDVVAPSDFICNPLSCTSWNGDIYWYGFCYSGGQAIIGFSMTYEVFDNMPVPEVCLLDNSTERKLFVLNNSLALVLYSLCFSYVTEKCFDIWEMNRCGWTKIFTDGPLVGLDRSLGFRDNGEFFLDSGDGRMRSYNIGTQEIKEYQVYGHPVSSGLQVLLYPESLVSVKRH